jgi:surfactin synthase thioesterase subunit
VSSPSLVRLFCFPYAGASASVYSRWKRLLPQWIEVVPVELPGRGRRLLEPLEITLPGLLERLQGQLQAGPRRPFAFFGHSMGAMVAFELAHDLETRGAEVPLIVFASGARAPSCRGDGKRWTLYSSDDELMAELKRLAGTPPEVLADPELMALTLPVLRADLLLSSHYCRGVEQRIGCPIAVLGGAEDDTTMETLSAWRAHTDTEFFLDILPGGHFFVHEHEAKVASIVQRRLRALLETDAGKGKMRPLSTGGSVAH